MNKVSFDKEKLKRFKKVYKKHEKDSNYVFVFEGEKYLVGYAKYLIHYLENKWEYYGG